MSRFSYPRDMNVRRLPAIAGVIGAALGIAGCTVGPPAAFRLTDSESIDFGICLGEIEISRVEVALTPRHWFWEHPDDVVFVADAVEPVPLRAGEFIELDDPRLTWRVPLSLDGDWTTVEVGLFDEIDGFDHEGGMIDHSRLVVDEWVWDDVEMRGQIHCTPIEGVATPLP